MASKTLQGGGLFSAGGRSPERKPAGDSAESMRTEKKQAALQSLSSAVFLTSIKLVVGLWTGSLGILSEAAHSALDLVAAFITYLSVRVSDKPADADHQYGHGKIEDVSAFIETGLLLLACVWIVWEVVERLFFHQVHIRPSPWAIVVLLVSMLVDWWRSQKLRAIADKYHSRALEADALHFRTDIWSSGAVLAGVALVWLGNRFSIGPLHYADPIAALGVAGVIVYVSWRLAQQTMDALLDAAPAGVRSKIVQELGKMPDVLEVERVRIRRSGSRFFVDLFIAMGRNVTFQRSEQIVEEVTAKIQELLPLADVVVRSIPRATGHENIFDRVRAVAARNNLSVHDVSVQDLGGNLHVEQHLELQEDMPLKQAHETVTRIEAEIRVDVPEIRSILTHIESEPGTIEKVDALTRDRALESRLRVTVAGFPEIMDVHDVAIRKAGDRLNLSFHCTMADDLPMSRVHDIITAVEIRIKQDVPELFKVLIHPEPQTDNKR